MAPPLYAGRQTYFQRACYKLAFVSKPYIYILHSTDSFAGASPSCRSSMAPVFCFTQTPRIWPTNFSFARSFSLSHPPSFRHSHSAFHLPKQQLESPFDPLKAHQLRLLVDGMSPSNAFSVTVKPTDTVGHLKELIKAKKAPEFDGIVADRISLWSVSISTNRRKQITLSALTPKDKEKIGPKRLDDSTVRISDIKAFGTDPPKRTIHAIVQLPPRAKRIFARELAIEPYDGREASMVFNTDKFKWFPLNDMSDFGGVRANPRYAYFDRTRYISILESFTENVLLFLRPSRFGKSLFLSTLAHFHGVQYKQNYKALFQDLDVDRDVKSERVTPGQYLIMSFDSSIVYRSHNPQTAENSLNEMINITIKHFYRTYAPYLGETTSDQLIKENISQGAVESLHACISLVRERLNNVMEKDDPLYDVKGIYLLADEYDAFSNEFLNPDDPKPWDQHGTGPIPLLKGFWAAVKGNLGPRSIAKCFITGVSPLSMDGHTNGFNVATYVSWREELSGLCGLTEEDILAALRLPSVCKSEDEVQKHFEIMKTNYDGYNFTELSNAPHVFNTNTCLEYLDSLIRGEPINPRAVSNSEVSESALEVLVASPIAKSIICDSLSTPENRSIPYEQLVQSFQMTHLAGDITTSKPAWLSYMLHIGGLTFDRGTKQLRITNLIAAKRFGKAVMDRAGLRYEDVSLAFKDIVSTGDIGQALRLYRQTMCIRDVGEDDFRKKEEHHRDSFYYALLGNLHPSLRNIGLEAWTTKPSRQGAGRVDMLVRVPPLRRILLLEWKVIQIGFLDIGTSYSCKEKAEDLDGTFEVADILELKFNKHDKWRSGQTINDWILKDPLPSKDKKKGVSPARQLAQYATSPEITQMKKELQVTAYLVVVVGSRQILFWEMDDDGVLQKDPRLA